MKLFTVGPTQMFDDTLKVGSQQLPYFRTNEFSNIVLKSVEKMKKLLNCNDDDHVLYITGSGSAAMESVISNSFDSNDKLLIINGGTFGKRFVKLAEIYNIPFDTIDLEYGEELTRDHFNQLSLTSYTALLVNIDETSTCQLYNIEMLSKICKENNLYFVVDAISSFLADEYDVKKYEIDCTIISSQKALSLSPGLSIIALSNEFYLNKIKNKKPINLYLNINEHLENMKRGQTPNSPAVGIILELANRLEKIKNVKDEIDRVAENAKYFRKLALEIGLEIPTYPLSNAATPIIFPNNNAKEVFEYLKDKYEIFLNPTGGNLENKILRVSHLGNLSKEDYDDLIEKIKEVL